MSAAVQAPSHMSVQEFLAWNPGDGQAWQLIDGVPHAMAPASVTHGMLQAELGSLIRNHLRASGSPCRLVTAPGIVPRVQARRNMRVPDLAVACSGLQSDEAGLSAPVLVIEILSPSNEAETWANVWAYTTVPSVREIVVLHSQTIAADILRRQPDGGWPAEPESVTEGDILLESVGFQAVLGDIYAGTRLAPDP